jgi:hypothetical protein
VTRHRDLVVASRGDDAGDARAVAVGVLCDRVVLDEVPPRHERVLEVGNRIDAGVDRRDHDRRIARRRLPDLRKPDLALRPLVGPGGIVRLHGSRRSDPGKGARGRKRRQKQALHAAECSRVSGQWKASCERLPGRSEYSGVKPHGRVVLSRLPGGFGSPENPTRSALAKRLQTV